MRFLVMPEYDNEQHRFVHTSVRKLMNAKDALFASIKTIEEGDAIPISQNTFEDGQLLQHEPDFSESTFLLSFKDIQACKLDSLFAQIDKAADENLKVTMAHMFAMITRTSEAAGNTLDLAGKPFDHDALLTSLDSMEISFDSNGSPQMPTLVVHPEIMKQIAKLPPETPEQIAAREAIIEKKRLAYYARKRHRQLPRLAK